MAMHPVLEGESGRAAIIVQGGTLPCAPTGAPGGFQCHPGGSPADHAARQTDPTGSNVRLQPLCRGARQCPPHWKGEPGRAAIIVQGGTLPCAPTGAPGGFQCHPGGSPADHAARQTDPTGSNVRLQPLCRGARQCPPHWKGEPGRAAIIVQGGTLPCAPTALRRVGSLCQADRIAWRTPAPQRRDPTGVRLPVSPSVPPR